MSSNTSAVPGDLLLLLVPILVHVLMNKNSLFGIPDCLYDEHCGTFRVYKITLSSSGEGFHLPGA